MMHYKGKFQKKGDDIVILNQEKPGGDFRGG